MLRKGLIGFQAAGCLVQFLTLALMGVLSIAVLALLLQLAGFANFLPVAGASPTPSATVTLPSALPGSPTPGQASAIPTVDATPNDPQSTGFDDTRLLPPENFSAAARPNGMLLVSWTWPSGRDLDPTFFRVNLQGVGHDFDFTGPGDYEEEVPAYCGGGNNFLTLDAFNTAVDPEANSQAENVVEIEPDC